jgi:hypothetical protein
MREVREENDKRMWKSDNRGSSGSSHSKLPVQDTHHPGGCKDSQTDKKTKHISHLNKPSPKEGSRTNLSFQRDNISIFELTDDIRGLKRIIVVQMHIQETPLTVNAISTIL